MAKYVQKGNTLTYLNPADGAAIKAGDVVALPARIGVAVADIAPGESGSVSLAEAFEFPASEAIPIGTAVYWNAADKAITATETGNTPAGVTISEKSGTTAGFVVVRLE